MKTIIATVLSCVLVAAAHAASDTADRITPEMQARIDAQKNLVAAWAASPVLVAAVKAQNQKGPIPGMSNRFWGALKSEDPRVQAFQKNAAGVLLAKKLAAGHGLYREAFLNAAGGELAAFAQKPTSYLHGEDKKFLQPMGGQIWQGDPEFDKSSHSYAIQLAAPVRSGGKSIGVLVVGLSMPALTAATQGH